MLFSMLDNISYHENQRMGEYNHKFLHLKNYDAEFVLRGTHYIGS